MLHNRAYGWQSAGQSFAPTFMRHMYDYGTTPEQVAHVKMFHSRHASNNPKAYYKKRFTVEDVINSRFICKPLHLLDCCVETDNAHLRHRHLGRAREGPEAAAGADPRRRRPLQQAAARHALPARADLDRRRLLRARRSCGRTPGSGRRMSTSPAPTTPSPSRRCCSSRITASARRARAASTCRTARSRLGGKRPNNTSGGHLCEGYTHGMNMVIENTRQLRHDVDDSCPIGARRQAPAHLRLQAKAAAARSRMSRSAPISAGPTRRPRRRWSCGEG